MQTLYTSPSNKNPDNPSFFSYKILASLFLLQKSSKSYIAKECTHNKSLKNSGNAVVAVYISIRTGYVNNGMLDRVQLNHVMAVYYNENILVLSASYVSYFLFLRAYTVHIWDN